MDLINSLDGSFEEALVQGGQFASRIGGFTRGHYPIIYPFIHPYGNQTPPTDRLQIALKKG